MYTCLMVIAYTFATVNENVYFHAKNQNNDYWSNTIIYYQVYPRSFEEGDNDGIGDLKGIYVIWCRFIIIYIKKLGYFTPHP